MGLWLGRPAQHSAIFDCFQIFFKWIRIDLIKRLPSRAPIFSKKYGCVDDLLRNKFPHWSFSKLELKYELKIGEPI
jgi:hypothetical protein